MRIPSFFLFNSSSSKLLLTRNIPQGPRGWKAQWEQPTTYCVGAAPLGHRLTCEPWSQGHDLADWPCKGIRPSGACRHGTILDRDRARIISLPPVQRGSNGRKSRPTRTEAWCQVGAYHVGVCSRKRTVECPRQPTFSPPSQPLPLSAPPVDASNSQDKLRGLFVGVQT